MKLYLSMSSQALSDLIDEYGGIPGGESWYASEEAPEVTNSRHGDAVLLVTLSHLFKFKQDGDKHVSDETVTRFDLVSA